MSYKIDDELRALLVFVFLLSILFHFSWKYLLISWQLCSIISWKLKGFSNSATWPQEKTSRKNHNKKNVILSSIHTWSIRLCAEHDHKKKPQTSQTFLLQYSPSYVNRLLCFFYTNYDNTYG